MKRTIIALLLAVAATVCAQQITVQAPGSVYEGDNFTVRFVVNAHANNFNGPSFKGFSRRSGPNQSSSSSISFVNGKTTSSVQTTFSYSLTADEAGTFTIDEATCTADNKKLASKPFTITVRKADPNRRQQAQQQQQRGAAQTQVQEQTIDEQSLFARTTVSNSHPYQGEQIIVTYKIYTQVPLSQYAIDKLPGNRGFWAEDLSEGSQVKQYTENLNGRTYEVAEIRRGALFAQQSGKLAIEPLNLDVLAMTQRQRRRTGTIWDLFDDPFFNTTQAVQRSLSTNRVTVDVKPLPPSPDGFTGAVGRFEVSGGLTLGSVKTNEAVSYKLTVSGPGNLMLIGAPSPEFPQAFEVYDPQTSDALRRGESGVGGSRTFEWVLIPRSQGSFTVPRLDFVFFDPQAGRYVTKSIAAQTIEVEQGAGQSASFSKDDVRRLAEDINFIHPVKSLRRAPGSHSAPPLFWLALAAMAAATAATLLLGRRHRRAMGDEQGRRRKRAVSLARKRLRRAEGLLRSGNDSAFYEEIYRAIWGCLADKYSIEPARLNRETVTACLNEKGVPAERQEAIMKVLRDVDLARFAPGDAHAQMQSIYDEALQTIVSLD